MTGRCAPVIYVTGLPHTLAHKPHGDQPLVEVGVPLCYLPVSGVQHAVEGIEVDACAHVHSSAKIDNLHVTLRRNQHILRLHVPVHDACAHKSR